MLKKKLTSIIICIFAALFVYAESGTLGHFFEQSDPHHEYYFNNNGKKNRYRIQMKYPHYAFYIDADSCRYYECFPNFEMGISREEGCPNYQSINCSALRIFPDIIFKDENLKDIFSIKGISRDEVGCNYNCYATDWKIYEKGLILDVLLINDIWDKNELKKLKRVYLELKEDGKYYETENAEKLGNLRKSYSAYDFLDRGVSTFYDNNFTFCGYSIYKMGSGRNIESVLISNIFYYNSTKDGIEFITPYGCGFFDFKTESMSLVPKKKYLGKEFTYTPYSKENKKNKEKKIIITENDFVLPDIKVPLYGSDLDSYQKRKQTEINQKKKDELLKAELLAQ